MNCPHCDVHIDEHEALPCLDTWVADEVLEWVWMPASARFNDDGSPRFGDPLFSVKYEEARKVVEQLTIVGWMVFVAHRLKGDNYCRLEWADPFDSKWDSIMVCNASIPLAICRAAIKAKGKNDDKA